MQEIIPCDCWPLADSHHYPTHLAVESLGLPTSLDDAAERHQAIRVCENCAFIAVTPEIVHNHLVVATWAGVPEHVLHRLQGVLLHRGININGHQHSFVVIRKHQQNILKVHRRHRIWPVDRLTLEPGPGARTFMSTSNQPPLSACLFP